MNTYETNSLLTSFTTQGLAKEDNFLASKQASIVYNNIRNNGKPGRGVESRHYARAFFTLLLSLLCLPLTVQGQSNWSLDRDGLSINGGNTNYTVTGNFNGGFGGALYAIHILGGGHEMTFNGVGITMPNQNSKGMYLLNTTLDLVLEGSNSITCEGYMSNGISLEGSSLFISGEGSLRITDNRMPKDPGIKGNNSSTVAITGGDIRLTDLGILIEGGTLIIGPEANVTGNVAQTYGAGFVFGNGAKNTLVKGNPVLPVDLTIPTGYTLNVPTGTSLTVSEGVTLTVNGTLTNNGTIRVAAGGSITGTVSGTVLHGLAEDMVEITKDTYTYTGQAITPTVTIEGYTEGSDYTVAYANNTNAGEATITITSTADGELYGEVTKSFTIEKATPTYTEPTGLTATYGQTLAEVKLPTGWTWEDATASVGEAGEQTFNATFTPDDTDNYTTMTVSLKVTVTNPTDPEEPENPDTPVIPDMPDYYNIMVDECEGVTVETSTNVVREGQSMTFTIDIAEGYTDENMTVKVKRSLFGYTEVIEPNNEGIYEVKNIYTDIYLTVDGVEEEEEAPTGMEDIEGAKVYTKDGSIYVQTPTQEQVQIISISGAVLKNEEQIGLQRYDLPRGIYIICIDEEQFKVRN